MMDFEKFLWKSLLIFENRNSLCCLFVDNLKDFYVKNYMG